ncbi:MAG TPA: alpha/beta hydrolase [Sphingomicrobium sp.]
MAFAAVLLDASEARTSAPETRYLYYLHGKIVEDLGPQGVSPRFGLYDYPGIIAALRAGGLNVISEARPSGTDPSKYADKVVADIRRKIADGVAPSHITVAGASKGSVIASLVSTRLRAEGVRYVLIANCNDWLIRTHDPRLTGAVLSIYEASDHIGSSCRPLIKRSPAVKRFEEVRLNTGLGHGIVYRPLPAWVRPTIAWARR